MSLCRWWLGRSVVVGCTWSVCVSRLPAPPVFLNRYSTVLRPVPIPGPMLRFDRYRVSRLPPVAFYRSRGASSSFRQNPLFHAS